MIATSNCLICEDKGFVLYNQKIDDLLYEFVSYCTCAKGDAYNYDGRRNEKSRQQHYAPCVTDVLDIRAIIRENQENQAKNQDIPTEFIQQQVEGMGGKIGL